MSRNGDYEVGYKRPPKHSRFKKGHTRSRSRRSREEPSASEYIDMVLEREVPVTVSGERVKMPAQELIVRQLVARARKGDISSAENLLKLMSHAMARGEDREIIREIVPREQMRPQTAAND